ncbi:MAG: sodium:calcium antiporter [Lachnospira eligens]
MSQTLIGLTIVSIGTSLPELVTSIVAARKNEVDMALGNAIGSNVFNILMVFGIASAISPISIITENIIDFVCLLYLQYVYGYLPEQGRRSEESKVFQWLHFM